VRKDPPPHVGGYLLKTDPQRNRAKAEDNGRSAAFTPLHRTRDLVQSNALEISNGEAA